jgi:hypothetical protein
MKENARRMARASFTSWKERIEMEMKIIDALLTRD